MKRIAIRLVMLTLVALPILVAAFFLRNDIRPLGNAPATPFTEWGFSMSGIDQFSVRERYGFYADEREENVSASRGKDALRVKILSGVSRQFLLIDSQYDTKLPPYPEFLTNKTGCALDLVPRTEAHPLGEYRLIPAGQRFNYGLCTPDLIRYRAGFGIFYCSDQKKVFQVEYFTDPTRPWSDVKVFMNSFECNVRT